MAIQHRRGVFTRFDPTRLLPGEWAIVLSGDPNAKDGRAVYVCFAAGTVKRMATYEDMVENMANAFEEFSNQFTSDVNSATSAANNAASNANGKATLANNAATAANTAAANANSAKTAADTAASNANAAAASASTAAQNANAAAAATANVVAEAVEALSHDTGSEAAQIRTLAVQLAETSGEYIVLGEALYTPPSLGSVSGEKVTRVGGSVSGETAALN